MLLVTGVTGLTGRFLLKALRTEGYIGKIRCLVRQTSNIAWMQDKDFELMVGDVNSNATLLMALRGVDTIIHLVSIRSSPQIINACNETGVRRAIFINTTGIFSKYQQYSEEYKQLEQNICKCSLEYTIIRPTMIYGNQQDKNIHKLVKIVNRYPVIPVIGNGYGLMQPIYAGDLANVIARAYINDVSIRKEYNVAGKTPVRFCDVMQLIAEKIEKQRLFINIPYPLALLGGYLGEIVSNDLINVERIKRLQEDKVFSYQDAEEDLGFSPLSFSDGIELEIDSLQQAGII